VNQSVFSKWPLPAAFAILIFLLPAALFAQGFDETELLWRQVLGGAALARPAAQLGSIVIVCEGGLIKAFGSTGSFLWEYKAGGRLQPFITRAASGASYVCRSNGLFLAINRAGRRLWQTNLKGVMAAPPLTGWDDRIFIFLSGRLLCFTATGTRLWQLNVESPLATPPVPDGTGGVAAVLEDGAFIRVDAFGQLLSAPLDAIPFALLPLTPKAEGKAAIAALYSDGLMELITGYGDSGGKSARGFLARLPKPPLAAVEQDGLIAALLTGGELALFSPEKGVLWSTATALAAGENQGIELTWNEDGIYLLSKNGGEGYNLKGERLWSMQLQGSSTVPILENGVLYSCGKDWIFYAYRLEGGTRLAASQNAASYSLKAAGDYGLGKVPPDAKEQNIIRAGFLSDILDTIDARVRQGNIGASEPLSTETLIGVADGSGLRAENIDQRLKAISILGLIGSRETVPFLAGLFRREKDVRIKGAAAEAIGAIGVDPDGSAFAVFTEFLMMPHIYSQERLLSNLAASIGSLCRFSGPPLSGRGIPLLVSLTDASQPKSVRRRAERELSSLYRK
jgi:outer membrane protein assembly factor BamB